MLRFVVVPALLVLTSLRPLRGDDSPAASATRAKLVVVAGRLAEGLYAGGELKEPFGVASDDRGVLTIVELGGGRVHRLTPNGEFTTVAGSGRKGDEGDAGPAEKATFNGMHALAISPTRDVYLADTWNNRVRVIDAKSGVIRTVVGTGKKGFGGDGGPATKADCGGLYCIAFDPNATHLYMADLDNRRIRVVRMADGIIETVAGNGKKGIPLNGAVAKEAPLVDPRAVACDTKGNVYVLERSGHSLRVVDPEGRIRTVAGTGRSGPPKDDVPALEATFNGPKHLCVDRHDDVIIADAENNVIVKYLPKTGRVVRIAGTGKPGKANLTGTPLEVELSRPHGVYVDAKGTLFVVDSYHERVLKWVE